MKTTFTLMIAIGAAAFSTDKWVDVADLLRDKKPVVSVPNELQSTDLNLVRLAETIPDPTDIAPEEHRLVAVAMPREAALLRAPVSEYLRKLNIVPGQVVAAGEEVVWLDDEEARRASSGQSQTTVALSERLKEAAASHLFAAEKLRRIQALDAAHNVTELESIEAKVNVKIAAAQFANLQAEITAAQHEHQRLSHLVGKHVCRSPISGTVTEVLRHEGEWIELGDVIARLESTELHFKAHVAPEQSAEIESFRASVLVGDQEIELELESTLPSVDVGGMRTMSYAIPAGTSLHRSQVVSIRLVRRESRLARRENVQ